MSRRLPGRLPGAADFPGYPDSTMPGRQKKTPADPPTQVETQPSVTNDRAPAEISPPESNTRASAETLDPTPCPPWHTLEFPKPDQANYDHLLADQLYQEIGVAFFRHQQALRLKLKQASLPTVSPEDYPNERWRIDMADILNLVKSILELHNKAPLIASTTKEHELAKLMVARLYRTGYLFPGRRCSNMQDQATQAESAILNLSLPPGGDEGQTSGTGAARPFQGPQTSVPDAAQLPRQLSVPSVPSQGLQGSVNLSAPADGLGAARGDRLKGAAPVDRPAAGSQVVVAAVEDRKTRPSQGHPDCSKVALPDSPDSPTHSTPSPALVRDRKRARLTSGSSRRRGSTASHPETVSDISMSDDGAQNTTPKMLPKKSKGSGTTRPRIPPDQRRQRESNTRAPLHSNDAKPKRRGRRGGKRVQRRRRAQERLQQEMGGGTPSHHPNAVTILELWDCLLFHLAAGPQWQPTPPWPPRPPPSRRR